MSKNAFVALLLTLSILSPDCGQSQQFIISIRPQFDIPLTPDQNLFLTSGGVMVSRRKSVHFLRPLSIGIAGGYHLGRMQHASLGNLGSHSLISAEAVTDLHWTIRQLIVISISGGAGCFYTGENGERSSWATDLMWSGQLGIGLITSSALTIGIQGEYRNFRRLYHLIGIGLTMDFRLGNVSRDQSRKLKL